MTAERTPLPWWWRLLRPCCFIPAGTAFLVMFLCTYGDEDPTASQAVREHARHQAQVCVTIATPLMIGFGVAALWLDRSARRRSTR